MSPWDQLQNSQKRRRAQKKRLAAAVLGGLSLATLAAFLLIPRLFSTPPTPDLSEIVAPEQDQVNAVPENLPKSHDERQSNPAERASTSASFSFGVSETVAGSDADHAARLARLEENLRNQTVANFQKTAVRARGPLQLTYTVSGSGQAHAFTPGQATFGDTDIVGAAGEWVVRPWWKPGWVPNSADCGEVGAAAIAGHVSWAGRPGPFHDLGAMTAGDEIKCQASSGRWYTYTVTEVVRIDYSNTDYYQQPLSATGRELTLFSCTPEISGIVVVRASIGGS